jgi:DNA-directed RNA polymerase beta subunit
MATTPKRTGPPPDPDDFPAGLPVILAATEKLLAVNRGLAEPDERDSMDFRRVMTPDRLIAERIRLDAGKIRLTAMRRVARARNLSPITANHFGKYTEGMIVGNPLSMPLEEINPLHLVEQARRVTQMGPGGIPSQDSITEETAALHPSTFGFTSPIEGPESSLAGVDVRLAWGARIGKDGKIYQKLVNRRSGQKEWVSSGDLAGKTVALPD